MHSKSDSITLGLSLSMLDSKPPIQTDVSKGREREGSLCDMLLLSGNLSDKNVKTDASKCEWTIVKKLVSTNYSCTATTQELSDRIAIFHNQAGVSSRLD